MCSPASKRKKANEAEKAAQREARERREEALWMAEYGLCGCDRDYLTVPLNASHRCTRPLVTFWVRRAFFEAFGHWPRYTRAVA